MNHGVIGTDGDTYKVVYSDGGTTSFDDPVEFYEHYQEWSVSEGEEGRSIPDVVLVIRQGHCFRDTMNVRDFWIMCSHKAKEAHEKNAEVEE